METTRFWDILLEQYFDYFDEIPSRVVNEGSYKVRHNWWTSVVFTMSLLDTFGEIPMSLQPEVQDFISQYTAADFQQRLTTQADLDRANALLFALLDQRTASPNQG